MLRRGKLGCGIGSVVVLPVWPVCIIRIVRRPFLDVLPASPKLSSEGGVHFCGQSTFHFVSIRAHSWLKTPNPALGDATRQPSVQPSPELGTRILLYFSECKWQIMRVGRSGVFGRWKRRAGLFFDNLETSPKSKVQSQRIGPG